MVPAADKPDGTAVMDRSPAAGPPERVASVDAFRGVVILLMAFFVVGLTGLVTRLGYRMKA